MGRTIGVILFLYILYKIGEYYKKKLEEKNGYEEKDEDV